MKNSFFSTLRRFSAALTAGIMSVAMSFSASAADSVNQKVKASQDGVYAIELQYVDSSGDSFPIQSGSAFFINDSDLLTCEHVVSMDSDTEAAVKKLAKSYYGSYSKGNVKLIIKLQSDISISASVLFSSPESDWAVIKAGESIKNSVLAFGESDKAENTQSVYAIGFPSSVANYKSIKNFSREDISTTHGLISKVTSENDINKIQHGATLSSGASGGPLVDDNGAVIGINCSGVEGEDYYFAVAAEQILSVLDQKKISYTRFGETADDTAEGETSVAEPKESTDQQAPAAVKENEKSNDDSSAADSDPLSTKTIIIIASAAVLAILIIVIIILLATRKKPAAPAPVKSAAAASPTVAQVFTLVRRKTGEKALIDKINYIVGKDRNCDYRIEGNNSISRNHARFMIKGSDCYICDLRSTNGTYVNNNRIAPNEEVKLRAGDVIRISDEEFELK